MLRLSTLICVLSFSLPALANFQDDLLKGKNTAAKDTARWTLTDWLSQKSRASLMDQWLALHHQVSWLELVPSGSYGHYKVSTTDAKGTTSVGKDAQTYGLDIYIGLLSLAGDYQKTSDNQESYGGSAGLRLIGVSAQSTSLVGRYGWHKLKNLTTQEHWENPYLEGQLQLYLIQQFGLTGKYRYYFPSQSNLGTRLQGHSVTAGAFFEFGVLRLFGNVTQEPMEKSLSGTVTKETTQGLSGGVQLAF